MDKKTLFRWWFILVGAAVFALACNLSGGSETPVAVEQPIVEVATVAAESQPTIEDTAIPPQPTDTTAAIAPTTTLSGDAEPTAAVPEPTETIPGTTEPVTAAPGTIAPGQQTAAALESDGVGLFTFEGIKFEPVIAFVEGDNDLDIALSAYQGTVAAGTDLNQLQPISQGDFSGPGLPEILVITPEQDGPITIAVQGNDTAGNFTMYMYDGTTPAANARLVNESVEPGQTNSYNALSNGGRPVIVFIDPTGQGDVVLEVQFENGEPITEANFGGPGSAETAYVLPLNETAYTILVSTVSDETAEYNLVIVTLD